MPETLPIRREQPPDDTALVIRGSTMNAENVRRAADRTFVAFGVYGISVVGVVGISVLEACRGDRIARYRRVCLSTFGRVRTAGFVLLATFQHPHFTLVLPDLAELTIARLVRCFDDPIPNPGIAPR